MLSFYRTIVRSTRRINDPKTRDETRLFARHEFERHRNVQDIVSLPIILVIPIAIRLRNKADPLQQHIRYLLSTGKTQWDSMERYIDGM